MNKYLKNSIAFFMAWMGGGLFNTGIVEGKLGVSLFACILGIGYYFVINFKGKKKDKTSDEI